jgi:hypothetical protein
MRYIITQHYTTEHQALFNLISPVNKAFALKNGFEYITDNTKRCPERQVWWEKIAWLQTLLSTLEDGTLVVWEDCDAINIGGDLKTALHPGYEYGSVHLRGGLNSSEIRDWYNSGVIFMLNTPDVRAFLKRVWDRNDPTDETSINKELASLKNTIGNSKSVCSLSVEWNSWRNNEHLTSTPFIKSWHGMKYEEKLIVIKAYIGNLKN